MVFFVVVVRVMVLGFGAAVPLGCAMSGPATIDIKNAAITPRVSNKCFMLVSSSLWNSGIQITPEIISPS
jgi:hypothetical protein